MIGLFHFNFVLLACAAVELTVQRNYKMQRSSSVSAGPLTPLAQRGGITAPLPVDVSTFDVYKCYVCIIVSTLVHFDSWPLHRCDLYVN